VNRQPDSLSAAHRPSDSPAGGIAALYPQSFARDSRSTTSAAYFASAPICALAEFFDNKGLAQLKLEEQQEQWYADWLTYQAARGIYAAVLTPRQYSRGGDFDLLRYARFLETFAYFSPGHGYSLQVTSLALFAILMGSNEALKREAVSAVESGSLLAFAVSEKEHGSDLLAGEFSIRETDGGELWASGSKYYIGNSNVAHLICILGKHEPKHASKPDRRMPLTLFVLRPAEAPAYRLVRKIRTSGVRAGFVGEFEVRDHPLPRHDLIAHGRQAWDSVLGAVTLGKFFLGFGSIGICEHAFKETHDYLNGRVLYGRPVSAMPHIRLALAKAYVRLTAMKLYAYRALDYVQSASAVDRRYLLFCAVQKARVSTEGVRVIALLTDCIGARGFETDTYLEMARRDAQLIPSLEGSAHINLAITANLALRYFSDFDADASEPPSLSAGEAQSLENPHLFEALAGAVRSVAFPHPLRAFRRLASVPNVRAFARQGCAFRRILNAIRRDGRDLKDTQLAMALGQCTSRIAYGQLIAEHAHRMALDVRFISAIFQLLVTELHTAILLLLAVPTVKRASSTLQRRALAVPESGSDHWDFVFAIMEGK
jgi:acyl-CoA dehydrogenase